VAANQVQVRLLLPPPCSNLRTPPSHPSITTRGGVGPFSKFQSRENGVRIGRGPGPRPQLPPSWSARTHTHPGPPNVDRHESDDDSSESDALPSSSNPQRVKRNILPSLPAGGASKPGRLLTPRVRVTLTPGCGPRVTHPPPDKTTLHAIPSWSPLARKKLAIRKRKRKRKCKEKGGQKGGKGRS
jgi:hypothetical protein